MQPSRAQFGRYAQCCRRFGEPESGEEQVCGQRGPETRSELTPGSAVLTDDVVADVPVSDDRARVNEDMSARPATAATPQPSLSLAKQSRRSKTPECLLAGRELGASKRGTRSRPLRRIASDATAHRPETAVNADSAWLLASRDLRRQQVGAGRTALGATRATQAGPTDDCWVAKPEAPCGAAGSDRDDRFVAQALASRRSPGGRNRSSGAALADVRLWAKAVVWRLAVFASCPRSEPVVSKRSGISPDLRQRLLERAVSANAKRCPLVPIRAGAAVSSARTRKLLRFHNSAQTRRRLLSLAPGNATVSRASNGSSQAAGSSPNATAGVVLSPR